MQPKKKNTARDNSKPEMFRKSYQTQKLKKKKIKADKKEKLKQNQFGCSESRGKIGYHIKDTTSLNNTQENDQ